MIPVPIWFRPWMVWAAALLVSTTSCAVVKSQRNSARNELQAMKTMAEAQKLRQDAAVEKAEAIGVKTSAIVKDMASQPLPKNDAEARQQAEDAAIRIRAIQEGLR